jgi:hypothetical protein
MVGTCPSNAPQSCVQGPTWSPNGMHHVFQLIHSPLVYNVTFTDPLFWMHHAVSSSTYTCTSISTFPLQMIDKLWHDWQHKHKSNFWSFHGGSVGSRRSASTYEEYPNGAPPFLNVSRIFARGWVKTILTFVFFSSPQRFLGMECFQNLALAKLWTQQADRFVIPMSNLKWTRSSWSVDFRSIFDFFCTNSDKLFLDLINNGLYTMWRKL